MVGRQKETESDEDTSLVIEKPTSTKHLNKGVYYSNFCRYSGLPSEWNLEVHRDLFGGCIRDAESSHIEGYKEKIPNMLIMLWNQLVECDGLLQEGIFRVEPSRMERDKIFQKIIKGEYTESCSNPHILSSLLKLWLRELEPRLLAKLDIDKLTASMVSLEAKPELLETFISTQIEEPELSAFCWVVDRMNEVNEKESINRINVATISTIMAQAMAKRYEIDNSTEGLNELMRLKKSLNIIRDFLGMMMRWRKSYV